MLTDLVRINVASFDDDVFKIADASLVSVGMEVAHAQHICDARPLIPLADQSVWELLSHLHALGWSHEVAKPSSNPHPYDPSGANPILVWYTTPSSQSISRPYLLALALGNYVTHFQPIEDYCQLLGIAHKKTSKPIEFRMDVSDDELDVSPRRKRLLDKPKGNQAKRRRRVHKKEALAIAYGDDVTEEGNDGESASAKSDHTPVHGGEDPVDHTVLEGATAPPIPASERPAYTPTSPAPDESDKEPAPAPISPKSGGGEDPVDHTFLEGAEALPIPAGEGPAHTPTSPAPDESDKEPAPISPASGGGDPKVVAGDPLSSYPHPYISCGGTPP